MPPKKAKLSKRYLSSAIDLDEPEEKEAIKTEDDVVESDSDLSDLEGEQVSSESDTDDQEEIIDRDEGEDAEIKDEDALAIVERAVQDLTLETEAHQKERKMQQKVHIPGDDVEDDVVCYSVC